MLLVLDSAASTRSVTSSRNTLPLNAQRHPKLVDTKSVNNTTLLHFLERTVAKHFPEMEAFIDELEKPAEAHRGAAADFIPY